MSQLTEPDLNPPVMWKYYLVLLSPDIEYFKCMYTVQSTRATSSLHLLFSKNTLGSWQECLAAQKTLLPLFSYVMEIDV